MKKYLGFISLIYSGIIFYLIIFNKIKYFLAPTLELYIKISVVPLMIIGLVLIINKKIEYKFKISDLILVIPLLMIILSGDGMFTSSLANNRVIKLNKKNNNSIPNEVIKEEDEEENINIDSDFSNVDFDIKDETYSMLANYITFSPNAIKFKDKKIRVKGMIISNLPYLDNSYMQIGRYEISCCAADAEFTGFVIKTDKEIKNNSWYEIEGILLDGKDIEGEGIMYIKVINLKEISIETEDPYIYPCYYYDNGMCSEVSKYDLE